MSEWLNNHVINNFYENIGRIIDYAWSFMVIQSMQWTQYKRKWLRKTHIHVEEKMNGGIYMQ